jgi:membrane protein implicated in regulation of membrane protease activity
MTYWYWLIAACLFMVLNLLTRFRPLLAIGAACLASSAAAWLGTPAWGQWLVFVGGVLVLEPATRWIFRRLHRPAADPRISAILGRSGRLRDVVDPRSELYILHCEGADWIGVPEEPGAVALGDTVQVVGVTGKRAVVRKTLSES